MIFTAVIQTLLLKVALSQYYKRHLCTTIDSIQESQHHTKNNDRLCKPATTKSGMYTNKNHHAFATMNNRAISAGRQATKCVDISEQGNTSTEPPSDGSLRRWGISTNTSRAGVNHASLRMKHNDEQVAGERKPTTVQATRKILRKGEEGAGAGAYSFSSRAMTTGSSRLMSSGYHCATCSPMSFFRSSFVAARFPNGFTACPNTAARASVAPAVTAAVSS